MNNRDNVSHPTNTAGQQDQISQAELIRKYEINLAKVKAFHPGWRGEEYVAYAERQLEAAKDRGMEGLTCVWQEVRERTLPYVVQIPKDESDTAAEECGLIFLCPLPLGKAAILKQVDEAIAKANDNNGERSDEIIASLEAWDFLFLGNPPLVIGLPPHHTKLISRPWVCSAQGKKLVIDYRPNNVGCKTACRCGEQFKPLITEEAECPFDAATGAAICDECATTTNRKVVEKFVDVASIALAAFDAIQTELDGTFDPNKESHGHTAWKITQQAKAKLEELKARGRSDEVLTYLDISTGHLKQTTRDALDDNPSWGLTIAPYEYGYFVSVPPFQDAQCVLDADVPKDLESVLREGHSRGCVILRFDADAPILANLPYFEDDSPSLDM